MHAVLILCGVKVHRLEVYDVMGMEARARCMRSCQHRSWSLLQRCVTCYGTHRVLLGNVWATCCGRRAVGDVQWAKRGHPYLVSVIFAARVSIITELDPDCQNKYTRIMHHNVGRA